MEFIRIKNKRAEDKVLYAQGIDIHLVFRHTIKGSSLIYFGDIHVSKKSLIFALHILV